MIARYGYQNWCLHLILGSGYFNIIKSPTQQLDFNHDRPIWLLKRVFAFVLGSGYFTITKSQAFI